MQICSAAIRGGPHRAAAHSRAQWQQGEQQQRGQRTHHLVPTQRQQQQQQQQQQGRRQVLGGLTAAAALAALGRSPLAGATGLESFDLPPLEMPQLVADIKERNQKVLDQAEESFQSSDLLKTLKERSEANRDGRKKELEDRYCRRQAEIGAGDCAGLRLIPGATKSGVQKKPEWMTKLLGMESEQ